MPKYTYKKANRILQDAQSHFYQLIPEKYHKLVSGIIDCEYLLTLIEEGHETWDIHSDVIDSIVKFTKSKK